MRETEGDVAWEENVTILALQMNPGSPEGKTGRLQRAVS